MKFIRRLFSKKDINQDQYKKQLSKYLFLFKNKNGIEIGGPSPIFKKSGIFPIYKTMNNCDGVNFSHDTVWTGNVNENKGYIIKKVRRGELFITDATDLSMISDNYYDFLLSSNNIEHIANPIKALEEWIKKLKKGGILVIIAPRKESNFDHKRKIVNFNHLLDDYKNNVTEADLTHLDEILELHDLDLDTPAGSFEQFRERSLNNIYNRCLHQHVFDANVLKQLYEFFNISIIDTLITDTEYIILGRK